MQDVDFTQSEGGLLLDYLTLRLNLIGVLNRIGGADATDAMVEILQSASNPAEIGLLASSLENHAAGTYRTDILNAARDSLFRIRNGELDHARNAAPLFAVFQDYGDENVILDIEEIYPRWNSYAAAALANMPEGIGIPALIALLERSDTGDEQLDPLPVPILAQDSRKSPEAGLLLLNLADSGLLSNATLISIGFVLRGTEYVLTTDNMNRDTRALANNARTSNNRPSYIAYNADAAEAWSVADIEQNLSLIDEFLATDLDPDAARALENSRTMLSLLRHRHR